MLPQGAVQEALELINAAAGPMLQQGNDVDTVPRCCTPTLRLLASLELQLAEVELQLGQEDLVCQSAVDPGKQLSFPWSIPGRDATPVIQYLESIELSQQLPAGQVIVPKTAMVAASVITR